MPTYRHGRHEYGQNFLTDPSTVAAIIHLVAATRGPIVEIGPGDGAITTDLVRLGRPLTAIEIDPRLVERLRKRIPNRIEIITGDFLDYRLPNRPHVLVGNLPFHQTTAILRRILHVPAWTDAILLMQWEVARRRAGVGNSTMMTTQWAPWFEFSLRRRVPARAFTPRPGVDGGLLTIRRREHPALAVTQRREFQALVHRVYTGSGRGLAQVLSRAAHLPTLRAASRWLAKHGVHPEALPGSLPAQAWVDLFKTSGTSPPRPRNTGHTRGNKR